MDGRKAYSLLKKQHIPFVELSVMKKIVLQRI